MKIYRFQSFLRPFHKQSLEQCEIFMTPPSWFNDPYDCRLFPNLSKLEDPTYAQKFVDQGLIQFFNELVSVGRNVESEMRRLDEMVKSIDKLYDHFDNVMKHFSDNQMGICCTSSKWNSISQWAYYANDHKGFCIEYDAEILRDSGAFHTMDKVEYVDDYPDFDPMEFLSFVEYNPRRAAFRILIKHSDWKNEDEYRLFRFYDKPITDEERVIKIPNEAITGVILGMRSEQSDTDWTKSICDANGWPLYKCSEILGSFDMQLKPMK